MSVDPLTLQTRHERIARFKGQATALDIPAQAQAWLQDAIWWRNARLSRLEMRRSALLWRWLLEPQNRTRLGQLEAALNP
jgi:hypothetical protein